MSSCEIHVHGQYALIKGDFSLRAVREVTSYPVEGAQFAPSYRKGLWDGRKHLMKVRTGSFPAGLVSAVKEVCEGLGYHPEVHDHTHDLEPQGLSFDLNGIRMEGKYDYQMDACKAVIEHKRGVVRVATGGGKSAIMAACTKYIGRKTLILVTNLELLYQLSKNFRKLLGASEEEVGIVGDNKWQPGSWVTVATASTLYSRMKDSECADLINSIEVIFADECHHSGSETWYDVISMCPAVYRVGFSGTPMDRTDGANLRLIACFGEVIVDIPNKVLVERGVTAKADIIFDTIAQPSLPKRLPYASAYKEGVTDNEILLQRIVDWTKIFYEEGLNTLILVEQIKQGHNIDEALWTQTGGVFIPHQFIHGSEDSQTRQKALEDFDNRALPVIVCSTIVDEGVDLQTIDALILAGSRKSKIRTMQRLGRGLRGDKLIAVEFANLCHKYLVKHSMKRLNDYKEEDCFGIYQSGPDKGLVQRLWNKEGDK